MKFSILAVGAFITTVLADAASIAGAIDAINAQAIKLQGTVSSFDAGILGLGDVIPLLIDSTTLLSKVKQGTKIAKASEEVDFGGAIGIAGRTATLVENTQALIAGLVNQKPRFDKLFIISPVVLINLKQQKRATADFGAAVIAKLPEALRETGTNLLAPVDVAFNSAIAEYKPRFGH